MRIMLAKNMGMCFGVKRALEIAERALERNKGKKIHTYGPLVHNKEVISGLEKKGAKIAGSVGDVEKGAVLIIRAHGVSDKDIGKAKEKGIEVVDATCPFVAKAKQAAQDMEKEDFKVVILGQKEHPEVIGIAESLSDPVIVTDAEDVKNLAGNKECNKLGLISQTTQSEKVFNDVVKEFKKLDNGARIEKTICSATSERQESAKETAKKSDIMIVVGGKNSANTKKLVEICSGITETKHIENVSGLEKAWFDGKEAVGITAGASTPGWIIDDVVRTIEKTQ